MRKTILLFSVFVIVAIAMSSCFGPSNEPTFQEADLLGLWARGNATGNDSVPVEFIRFTAEQDEAGEYKYGREWNESEDVYESDLEPYGNGWFKYKLVKSDLTKIHLMSNGGAAIPKEYVVIKLSAHELKYKDDFGTTHHYYKYGEQ